MKRTLALFLTLCMALSMFSFPAFAAEADVAVLDEAALVETETTPAPTEDVVAPVAADEPVYAVKFDATGDELTYTGNDLTSTANPTVTVTKDGADDDSINPVYSIVGEAGNKTYNSFAAAIAGRTLKDTNESITVKAAVVVDGVEKAEAFYVISVVPFDFGADAPTVTIAAQQYGAVKDLNKAVTYAVTSKTISPELQAEMQAATTVQLYSDSHEENLVSDADAKAYKKLYAKVSLADSGHWTNYKAPATQELSLDKNTSDEGATFAFKKTVYNTSVDTADADKDLPKAADLKYTGAAANLGDVATDGTLTWVALSKEDLPEGGLSAVVWPWQATADKPATTGIAEKTIDGATPGTWYVGAYYKSADNIYYKNMLPEGVVEVNVSKSTAGVKMTVGGEDITKKTVEIPYGGSSATVTVTAVGDPNLTGNSFKWEVEGAGDIGFKGDNDTNKPYLPGTYKVKVTQTDSKDPTKTSTAVGSFKIVPVDLEGMNLKINASPSDNALSNQFTATPPTGPAIVSSDYDVKTTVAAADGTVYEGDTTVLPAGTYTVTYEAIPKDVTVTAGSGYSTEKFKTVQTVNAKVLTANFTIDAGPIGKDVTLEFPDAPTAVKTVKYNSDFTISADDILAGIPYIVKVDGADVTDTANYTFDLYYQATAAGDWTKVDKFSGIGNYTVAVTVTKDGKSASSVAATTFTAKVGVTVTPGALNIKYNMPNAVADGKTNYSKALKASGVFELTDKITGKPVTAKDTTIVFTPAISETDPTAQNNYGFTATFDCDGLYMDDTIVKNNASYTGVFKVLGKNSATVEFKKGDFSTAYTGKSVQFTKDDVTVSDNVKDPVVAFTYEKLNDKGVYVASAAPMAYGTYRVTATLQPETASATNGDSTSIIVKVTPADATLTLSDKDAAKNTDYTTADTAVEWPTAELAGVNSEDQDTVLNGSVLTYHFYKDGKLMTKTVGDEEIPYTLPAVESDVAATKSYAVPALTDMTEPGVYTMTVEWTNTKEVEKKTVTANENYNPAAAVASKSYTLKQSAFTAADLPDFNKAEGNYLTIPYGTVKAGAPVLKVTTGATKGTFYIADNATGSVDSMDSFQAKIIFVPEDKTVASYTVPSNQTVKVGKYTFTDKDVKVVGTKVDKFDGKEYALTSVTVTPKFASDSKFLKVEYNSYNGKGWVTDLKQATRTSSGIVTVRVTDTNEGNKQRYVSPATFNGFIEIGKSELSTLVLESVERTYLDDGKAFAPKLVIKTPGLADKVVDAADVDYQIADYTENMDNAWFDDADQNGDVHAAEKPYYVKATIKGNALNNKYSTYNLGENTQAVAYSTAKVSPMTLDESKLATTIDTSAKLKTSVDTAKKLNSINLTNVKNGKNDDENFAVEETNTGKNLIAGTWAWKDADKVTRDAYADYTLVFTATALNKLTEGGKATATDYVQPTAKLNPTVTPMPLTVTGTVKVSPEKVPYGTTLGDLTVDAKNLAVDPNMKGTWVWAEGNDYVMSVGKHATKPDDKTSEADAQLVLTFRANEKPLNYSGNAYATVEVEKAEPVITVTNTTMAYTGNPASLKVESTNTETEPKLTWYDAKGNTIAGAPTQIGKYKVKVSLPETKSFKAGSVTVDYEITFNQTGIEGFVYRLYAVALGREPDQNGYTMWVNLLKAKEYTPKSVAYGFIFSPEFTNRKYDNATFLNVMYKTFMDREPDASGYAMWLKGLNSGEYTREFVFNGFADSKEFTNICKRYGL